MGVVNDVIADATENGPSYLAPATGTDNNEFRRLALGHVNDHLSRNAGLHREPAPHLRNTDGQLT